MAFLFKVADELQLDEGDVQQKVQNFAAEKLTGNQKQPKFPLIRPRIEVIEVEQGYSGRIANPQDMFTFKRKITGEKRRKSAREVVHRFKEVDPDKQLEVLSVKNAIAAAINEDNIDEVLAGFYEKEKYTYNDMLKMLDSRIQKRGDPNPPRGSLITTMTTLA
ncbi:hypothetical protein pipiens_004881 [Culex pipiens pipiens]|uniref:Mre11 DNA-binding domain-containing protein n=1 Tax=Culex pipiens pipiens TaxID=38569 RepID=A0ABD1CDV0_CULPP